MKRVLVTGISGTGKSTAIARLAERGHKAIDADTPEYSEVVTVAEDELTGLGGGKDWVWRAERIQAVLDAENVPLLFLSGTSPNQGQFSDRFDAIILLTAPADVIVVRLATAPPTPSARVRTRWRGYWRCRRRSSPCCGRARRTLLIRGRRSTMSWSASCASQTG